MTSTSRISKYMAVTEETNYTYFFLEVERSSAQDISKKCLTSCSKDFVFVQNAIPWRNMVPGSQDQRDLRSGRSAQGRLCCGLNRYHGIP